MQGLGRFDRNAICNRRAVFKKIRANSALALIGRAFAKIGTKIVRPKGV